MIILYNYKKHNLCYFLQAYHSNIQSLVKCIVIHLTTLIFYKHHDAKQYTLGIPRFPQASSTLQYPDFYKHHQKIKYLGKLTVRNG